jgi:hypothetical protein
MCREGRTDSDEKTLDAVGGRNAVVAEQEMRKLKLNGQEREDRNLRFQESEDRKTESLLVDEG